MSGSFPWLVADVGGTNARFSLVLGCSAQGFEFAHTQTLPTVDFACFEDCLTAYLSAWSGARPTQACIAVAGPVTGDHVCFTNLSWSFSRTKLSQLFSLERFEVLNDFAALAYSVPNLGDSDVEVVLPGTPQPLATKAIIGPGTGLGVAGLVHTGERWWPVPGEGGHVSYPAQTPREMAVAQRLQQQGYLCAEKLISGTGLVNFYNTLAELDGLSDRVSSGAEVSEKAFQSNEPLALETMNLFCDGVGTLASDAAVMYAAKGGIYLGGGILPRMLPFFKASGFEQRLKDKGVQSAFMNDIPVYLITHPYPALIGAAGWLLDGV